MQRIFVGDVQGCADELEEVLARARREFGEAFELWSVGDLVNRGPHSHRALALVRERVEKGRAQLVLGNHELALLGRWLGTRNAGPLDSLEDLLERPDLDEWCEWLRRRPLAVAGEFGARRFVMVHAAVAPQWSLSETLAAAEAAAAQLAAGERSALAAALRERDDRLGRLVSCRSVRPDGSWSHLPPARLPGAEPWHAPWTRAGHDYGVVYGHWSQQGLHVAAQLRGLDTGCVLHGGPRDGILTAWVPDPRASDPFAVPDARFWRIPARRAYYRHDVGED